MTHGNSQRHPPEASGFTRLRLIAEEETRRLYRDLPRRIRERIETIPVVCEKRPSRALVADGVDPDLLGLFVGNAYPEPDSDPLPPEIMLFVANLWDEAGGDEAEFRNQVRITLLHEIGHFLGLDEADLIERNLE